MFEKKQLDSILFRYSALASLANVRKVGRENFEGFIERLALSARRNEQGCLKESDQRKKHNILDLLFKIRGQCRHIFTFIKLIPRYHKQYNTMFRDKSENLVVVALSSKRIPLTSNKSIRTQLVELCKPEGKAVLPSAIRQEIESAFPLLLCDPGLFSDYWGTDSNEDKSHVFIIDGGFLLITQIYEFLLRRCLTAFNVFEVNKLYRILKENNSFNHSFFEFIKFFIFDSSNTAIFQSCKKIAAIFLTSNSVLTEQLRASLLGNEKCKLLVEILHGVPSKELDDYYAHLFSGVERGKASVKQTFIPLLSHNKLPKVMSEHLFSEDKLAINIYLNSYLTTLKMQEKSLLSEINDLIGRVINTRSSLDPLIVTYLGGTNFSGNFVESAMFAIEKKIIQEILNELSRRNRSVVLLYSYHPAHNKDDFLNDDLFNGKEILLVDNTIPTWFISHAGASLFSSALFEMAFLGVKPLSLMTVGDDLFTNEQLEAIGSNVSGNTTGINEKIKDFIDELLSTELSSTEVQIKQRAEILGIELDEFKNSTFLDKSKSKVFCA